mmetsp:Transcript_18305/g.36465  ORF Transcript_18305/g.36465 Transcript_18305/m.36465 type:complete len:266 (+) Transcript_18305:51-848(+)
MPTDNDEVPPTYASTQTISSPDPTNPPPVSSQAKDRWGILRRAIVSKSSSSCERKSSIHRFTGFRTYVTRSQSVTVGDEYVGRLSTVRISRYRTRRWPDLQGSEDPPRAPVSAEEEYDSDKDSPGHPLYKTAYRIRVATCGLRCLDLDPDVTLIAAGHAISTLLDLYAAMERRGAVKAMASIITGMHEVVGGGQRDACCRTDHRGRRARGRSEVALCGILCGNSRWGRSRGICRGVTDSRAGRTSGHEDELGEVGLTQRGTWGCG